MRNETIKKNSIFYTQSVKNGEKTTADYREILHLIKKKIKNKEDPWTFLQDFETD